MFQAIDLRFIFFAFATSETNGWCPGRVNFALLILIDDLNGDKFHF